MVFCLNKLLWVQHEKNIRSAFDIIACIYLFLCLGDYTAHLSHGAGGPASVRLVLTAKF